ncbi:MAG TPA: putative lipid II flippase FtsW [Candidatus Binataceae bacterium]|nr:putative lipid II flippase FtsW [Candidatus Binataceae bacterium]
MRNAGEFFRSWFGSSEAVDPPQLDAWLYGPAAALLLFGLLMVLNTTYFLGLERTGDPFHFFKAQLYHVALGLGLLVLLSQLSVKGLKRLVAPLAVVAVAALLAVWIPGLGVVRGGARRWVRIGPVLAEPSELAKLALVFFLADFLSRRQERMSRFKTGPLPAFIIVAPIALLVLRQPDFGNTVMIAMLLFAMLFAAGARPAHLGAAGGGAAVILALQAVAKPYRMRRLSAFVNPWRTAQGAGFQLVQSFIALGAGGAWGVGLGADRQKMFYLPQAHTDFVFAVVGEETGLVGALGVLALFGIMMMRGMRIAHEEPDAFASLLAVGLTALLSMQAVINTAVVIGLLPTKGLPLPFLSYGGTAMVMAMAALGAMLALARRPAVR